MLRVYLAAPFELQEMAARIAAFLATEHGIGCTSRWLTAGGVDSDEWARYCLADVGRCDVFVVINPEAFRKTGTGGRHVEFGYALALRKPVVIVGEQTNLFHTLAEIETVSGGESLVDAVRRLAARHHLEIGR